jgi:hypothetical protein
MGVLSCYLVLRTVTLKRAIIKFFPPFFLVGCFDLLGLVSCLSLI